MAKTPRGGKRGAIGGKKATGKPADGKGKGGRKSTGQYNALSPSAKQQVQMRDCIARGPHDKNCICNGTGKIKTIK
jgi:hypothetical protein